MQLRILLAAALALLAGCASSPQLGPYGSAHEHADFKVYLIALPLDFSGEEYQSPLPPGGSDSDCGNESRLAHLHGGDGDVVHKHATGVTWGYFFSALGMNLSKDCLALGNGTAYCDSPKARWRFFLNGNEVGSLDNTEIRNLDRALFTYDSTDAQIREQLSSVTYKAAAESAEGGSCQPQNSSG